MRTPRTTALMLTRRERLEQTPEAEPVTVEAEGDVVRLTLDDGLTLDLDRRELGTDEMTAMGVAIDTRQITQSQGRAPNVEALFATKLRAAMPAAASPEGDEAA